MRSATIRRQPSRGGRRVASSAPRPVVDRHHLRRRAPQRPTASASHRRRVDPSQIESRRRHPPHQPGADPLRPRRRSRAPRRSRRSPTRPSSTGLRSADLRAVRAARPAAAAARPPSGVSLRPLDPEGRDVRSPLEIASTPSSRSRRSRPGSPTSHCGSAASYRGADVLWRPQRVIVEVDGAIHTWRRSPSTRDRRRDRRAAASTGWRAGPGHRRATSTSGPTSSTADLRGALGARSARVTSRVRWTPTAAPSSRRRPATTRARSRGGSSRGWLEARLLHARGRGDGRGELLDRDPAAERDRVAAHGPRAQQHDPGHARPQARGWRAGGSKWILGTDHAGIATQSVVEKELRERGHRPPRARPRGLRRARLGVARAVRRPDHRAAQAARRLRRLRQRALHPRRGLRPRRLQGLRRPLREGPDLPRQLHGQLGPGLALGDQRPRGREPRGRPTTLYSIDYPVEGSDRVLTVATVRPETMLADTAVAVHPDDERYADLVGGHCVLPLVGRRLPIIADDHVDPEFGTGALKITPGHDPNDFEIGRKHGLEEISVIGEDGLMNDARRTRLRGPDAPPRPRSGSSPRCARQGASPPRSPTRTRSRSRTAPGERIEPLISLQWFCRDGRAREAGDRGRPGRPRHLHARSAGGGSTSTGWRRSAPGASPASSGGATSCRSGTATRCEETIVAETRARRRPASRCGGALRRDEDVLDTWFSSALWPFATLGWPDDTPELRAFYPTDVLSRPGTSSTSGSRG